MVYLNCLPPNTCHSVSLVYSGPALVSIGADGNQFVLECPGMFPPGYWAVDIRHEKRRCRGASGCGKFVPAEANFSQNNE